MSKKSQLKKLIKNNSGMALVTVIVAIGFVAAIVSILLMTTLINFKMKSTNQRSKDTFYSAEQVLDEINVGLQRKVSDAISTSYIQIMEEYGDYDNDQKKEIMMTRYYERLWDSLEYKSPSGHIYYDVDYLESLLKTSTRWHGTLEDGYGAIVTAIQSDGTESKIGDMVTYTKEGVVLKNLKIYYKDSMGFVSVIQTDIRLAYPEFEFATSSMIADITEYSFIADGGFEITGEGTLLIDGDVYTNDFIAKKRDVELTDTKTFITKYDLNLDNKGSFTTGEDTNFWARNIKAKSSEADIKGIVNVANDMNLMGKDSKVKISGQYIGYGCSTTDANLSSAILINGTGSTIDFSDLSAITVAGHAYVGTSKATDNFSDYYKDSIYASRPETMDTLKDIYTGQSLAVKSDQLCYLVPAEAIGVDNMTGRSMYNKNPLTEAEFNSIVTAIGTNDTKNTDYVMISDEVIVDAIGDDLSHFLQYSLKTGQTKPTPDYYKHVVRTNEIGADGKRVNLVYLYMQFDDNESLANEYYNLYYNMNKDSVEKYTDLYLDKVVFPNNSNQLLTYITAGNILVGAKDTEKGFEVRPESESNASSTLQGAHADYDLRFTALCSKLVQNHSELKGLSNKDGGMAIMKGDISEDKPEYQKLFENIVDVERLDEFCTTAYDLADAAGVSDGGEMVTSTGLKFYPSRTGHNVKFVDAAGNIAIVYDTTATSKTISDENVHLVISGSHNDITVTVADFKGLVLCNGKFYLTGNSANKAIAEPATVRALLQAGYEKDENTHAVASVLTDGSDFVYRTGGSDDDAMDTSLSSLITYENWKKE